MGCMASRTQKEAYLTSEEKQDLLNEWKSSTPAAVAETGTRLDALRKKLRAKQLNAYIVPTADAHNSEYTAACDRRREYISGFTGSAGTAIVLLDSAHLFTDGRYHIQASQQLNRDWTLHKVGQPQVDNWPQWLAKNLPSGTAVGIDPTLISHQSASMLASTLNKVGIAIHYDHSNLVDKIWDSRPEPVFFPIYEHEMKYAGVSATDKISTVREWLSKQNSPGAYVLSSLDEIAWLFNVRGASIPCNPVFPAYAVVKMTATHLFIDPRLVNKDSASYFASLPVELHAYDDIWSWIKSNNWCDMQFYFQHDASVALVQAAGQDNARLLPPDSPVAMAKATKNEVEQRGMHNAYLRDGAAWVRWAAWLEEAMGNNEQIDEREAADVLQSYRMQDPMYAMESYDAISATNQNAALPHYETPKSHGRVIDKSTPYLNDSGAQYHDGTIDTTRTVHFGTPTFEQRRAYTRVLQGHMALAQARFPQGTTGAQLDMLARQPLFQDGFNYLHGTGHGIGAFLNVHEGPYGFSSSSGGSITPVALEEGMAVSDEPGFYEEGQFGIRIESVFIVKSIGTYRDFGGKWLHFELVTRVPISTKMIDFRLLNDNEKIWLYKHNALCRHELLPMVEHDARATRWLQRQ
ncbi:Xaa-Pro aminopeptidase [Malassezia yamatoensis]|uniref:Xaa-Pro aminopeptidase n=1 Tax=Malassezia yamatoensis TaxID=253288 RepID=A0AAJ6CG63_9BASI|nr:Xaa-Pro aminopeptidase [Malassezia yamatoensis]